LAPLWPQLCAHPYVAAVLDATAEFNRTPSASASAPAVSPAGIPPPTPSPAGADSPCSSELSGYPFSSGRYFLTQRLYDGDLLCELDRCRRGGLGGLDESLCARWFGQLASALAHCHSLGVFHRDLKLENVWVDRARRACFLGDFGAALVVDRRDCSDAHLAAATDAATNAATVVPASASELGPRLGPVANIAALFAAVGSPRTGDQAEAAASRWAAADVRALGGVLHCMATGRHPAWRRAAHPPTSRHRDAPRGSTAAPDASPADPSTSDASPAGGPRLELPPHVSPLLADLLNRLLAGGPRLTLQQVLAHAWLAPEGHTAAAVANQLAPHPRPNERAVAAAVAKQCAAAGDPFPRTQRAVTDEYSLSAHDVTQSSSPRAFTPQPTEGNGLNRFSRTVTDEFLPGLSAGAHVNMQGAAASSTDCAPADNAPAADGYVPATKRLRWAPPVSPPSAFSQVRLVEA
jgi:serine/threonine protein kinase